ncbi:hypothetical protein DFR60_101611 [Hungatella effluvii]|uniref:Uncharacterized protein n=1 Tax=Hungatella effluvii TaxID=1096246 RepID=A0A2V3YDW7_9FIRM|nr:hypothetical protein DFR60_101611 [Hungatella effluvii]
MEIPFQPVPPDDRRFFDWVLALPRNSSLPTRGTAVRFGRAGFLSLSSDFAGY